MYNVDCIVRTSKSLRRHSDAWAIKPVINSIQTTFSVLFGLYKYYSTAIMAKEYG